MVEKVLSAFASPFFRSRVTGPEAPYQLILKAEPVVTPTNCDPVMPKVAAEATVKAAAARRAFVNCILINWKVLVVEKKDCFDLIL